MVETTLLNRAVGTRRIYSCFWGVRVKLPWVLLVANLLFVPLVAFAQTGEGGTGPVPFNDPELHGHLITMLAINLLAGFNYTCLGWVKKFRRKAVGEDVPIDWGKFTKAVALGGALGAVAFIATGLGVFPVTVFTGPFEFGVWFAASTGSIMMVDRWLIQGSLGSKAQAKAGGGV